MLRGTYLRVFSKSPGSTIQNECFLRILAIYAAKNSKICNFWTFWPVILTDIDQNIQKLLIFAVFASYIASILKSIKTVAHLVAHFYW